MKSYILFFVLLCSSVLSVAQTAVLEPDFDDVFFRLDSGKLIPLERQTPVIKAKAGGFIVMNVKTSSEFPGTASSVRFKSGTPLDFIVRSSLPSTVDPNDIYVLRKLEVKKKTRELVIASTHASIAGVTSRTNLAEGAVPVDFKRYGASSVDLSVESLPAGEYALTRQYGQTVYCFGID